METPYADSVEAEIAADDGRARVRPGAIGIRCLACGSDDLDASAHPRGDEVVRCRNCGAFETYRTLETAAVEAVRRERMRRLGD